MGYTTDLAYYKIKQLEEENAELRKKCTYFENLSTERFKAIEELMQKLDAECKKKHDLQHQVDMVGKNYCEAAKRVGELVREKGDLRRQLGSLNTSLGRLRERYEEEVVCRRKWAKLATTRDKRIEELQRHLDTLTRKDAVFIDLDSVKLKGMEELWAMLGEMFSADPCKVVKVFGWFSINNIAHYTPDVSEFLKKYETWKNGDEEPDKYIQKFYDDYEAWKKDK